MNPAFVRCEAARCVSVLCEAAGGFLGSRIKNEWGRLMAVISKAKVEVGREMERERGGVGRGVFSEARKVWEAFVGVLVGVVGSVGVEEWMFDEVLEVLGGELGREDVRGVLEAVNADAVWLVMFERGEGAERMEVPAVEGYTFAPFWC